MSEKIKFELEMEVKSSAAVLFSMISTPSGLSEWFADNVNIKEDVFTFIWSGDEEQARLIGKKKNEFVRFQWLEDEEEGLDTWFEIAIRIDELTKDVALIITDFAEKSEIDEAKMLWNNLVDDLKMTIGS